MSPLAGPTWLGKAQTHRSVLSSYGPGPLSMGSYCVMLGTMLFKIYKIAISRPSVGQCTRMRRSGHRTRMSYVCVLPCAQSLVLLGLLRPYMLHLSVGALCVRSQRARR